MSGGSGRILLCSRASLVRTSRSKFFKIKFEFSFKTAVLLTGTWTLLEDTMVLFFFSGGGFSSLSVWRFSLHLQGESTVQ